jgi:predicted SnoaL-like aldol condensation-catalyzing enzyme
MESNRMTVVLNPSTGEKGSYEDWVALFTELWQGGSTRCGDFMSIMSPDIKLIAPGLKSTRGTKACLQAFQRTFSVLPDLTAEIHRWSANGDTLFIEMTFSASVGGKTVTWSNVDRFIFRDGMAVERVAYFNPTKVRKAFLRSPRGWLQLLQRIRSGL